MAKNGLIIAGLSSGSGKTTVTLGLIRALCRQKADISAAKCGPDYIDCGFLTAASGRSAITLDEFAMPDEMLRALAGGADGATLIIEGVMGLFDGTDGGRGSTAALASKLRLESFWSLMRAIRLRQRLPSLPVSPANCQQEHPLRVSS
jgi:cobyrinic acid a,c-diamide synthase